MKKIICLLLFIFLYKSSLTAGPFIYLGYQNHTQNTSFFGSYGITSIYVPANIGDSVTLWICEDCYNWAFCWYFNGDTIPGTVYMTTPLHTVITQPGDYMAAGCTALGYFYISASTTGISSIQNLNYINIFPTAVTSSITIQLNSIKSNDIEISFFDMNGRQLKNDFYKNVSGEFIKNENTEALAKGIYFLRIKTGPDVLEKKFVKR